MKPVESLPQQYESLSEAEQLVMHILSCFHLPIFANDIDILVRKMTLNNELKAAAKKSLMGSLLKSLSAKRLVKINSNDMVECIPEAQEYIFGRLVSDAPYSSQLFTLAEISIRRAATYVLADYNCYITLFKFRQALHLKQSDTTHAMLDNVLRIEHKIDRFGRYDRFSLDFSGIRRVFGSPFSEELFELLPTLHGKQSVLCCLFNDFRINGDRIEGAMLDALLKYINDADFFQYLLFCGDFESIKILMNNNPETALFYIGKGFLAIADGDVAAAGEPFAAACDLLCRAKKLNDDQFFIAFYLTYLIGVKDENQFKFVLSNVLPSSRFDVSRCIRELKKLYDNNSVNSQEIMFLCRIFEQDTTGWALVKLLWTYWFELSPDSFRSNVNAMSAVLAKRDKAGCYTFVKLLWNKQSAPNEKHPLFALLPKVERWQAVLDELILAYSNVESLAQEEHAERLVWKIDLQNKYLTAVIQKRGKAGKWSIGRQVSFSNFSDHVKSMPAYITSSDTEVILYVKRHTSYYERAIKLSVDLFRLLANAPYIQYENGVKFMKIVFAEPTLSCVQAKGVFRITLNPPFGMDENFACVYDNKELLTVYTLSTKLATLAKYLNGSLDVPSERGLQKVEKLISVITPHVELEGDIASFMTDLKHIEGETKVVVRIYPFETGLQFEIVALPHDGFAFVPGKGNSDFVARLPEENVVVCRNFKQEKHNANGIMDLIAIFNRNPADDCCWSLAEPFDALEALADLKAHEHIILEWPQGETLTLQKEVDGASVFQSITAGKNDWFSIAGELELDEERVLTMRELLKLWGEKRQRFIQLSDKTYIALSRKLQKALEDISAVEQGDSKTGGLQVHKLSLPLLQEHFEESKFDNKTADWLAGYQKILTKTMPVPAGFTAQLRDYQHDGVQWLMRLAGAKLGALLADDMGLGKTVQAIALLQQQRKNGAALIVAPASVCFNWAD
ncbi:MAG: SNF2-related protein, partial [Victivallaceae bacterium]